MQTSKLVLHQQLQSEQQNCFVLQNDLHKSETNTGCIFSNQRRFEELCSLAESRGLIVQGKLRVKVRKPDPTTFYSKGLVERVELCLQELSETGVKIHFLLVDESLKSAQVRNLRKKFEIDIIDRTSLIIEIFATRAKSYESKLQIELAQRKYELGNLVRTWTHLERQRGGTRTVGGPGERQIEMDRRILNKKIVRLEKRLQKVDQQRGLRRRRRDESGIPKVCIVGYTNTGKSTLFNKLTNSKSVLEKDMLFATLEAKIKRMNVQGLDLLLIDSVGFISELPHLLVSSFQSTLAESVDADLLIILEDKHEEEQTKGVVQDVLQKIGADDVPMLFVVNKFDSEQECIEQKAENVIAISALHGYGINFLKQCIFDTLGK